MAVDIRITNTNNPNLPKRTLLKSLRGCVGAWGDKGSKYSIEIQKRQPRFWCVLTQSLPDISLLLKNSVSLIFQFREYVHFTKPHKVALAEDE